MKRFFKVTTLLLAASLAFAKHPKIAKDLDESGRNATVDVIVQYKQTPGDEHHAKVTGKGGRLKTKLDLVRGGHYSLPASELEALADDPDVASISPDRQVTGSMDYAVQAVGADVASSAGFNGTNIGVAVIDSGISGHGDLNYVNSSKSRVVYSQNFTSETWVTDSYGHGTHVAGVIGGNGTYSSGATYFRTFRGVAPNTKLINLKVLDQNGIGTDSQVIAAIQRAIALKKTYNIRVINLSLGRPVRESYKTDPLCQAVEQAWKAGIVVVVAAGNEGRNNSVGTEGYATITAPGNDPYVITVGAMKTLATASRADDQIASYSSKGPTLLDHIVKPDLVAPGNRTIAVRSAGARLALNYPVNQVPRSYYATANLEWFADYVKLSGTSMATPMVSGAVAILLQKTPSLTPDQVKARLMKTASKTFPVSTTASDPVTGEVFTSQYDIFTVGAGYLDILAALNNTDVASGAALSPAAVYNASTGTVSLVNGPSVIWGTSVVWGTNVVWGTSVVWGSNVVWGTNVIWGTSGTQGFNVVWGNSVIWGAGQPTSEAIGVSVNGEN